jgi:hypothetical protein
MNRRIYNMNRLFFKILHGSLAATFFLVLAACSSTSKAASTPTAGASAGSGIASLNGYQTSLFASSTPSYHQPTSAAVDNGHVFIGYQNNTAADGSSTNTSTIVEYTMNGKVVKTFSVPGQSESLEVDPTSHLLWIIINSAANPALEIIDPTSGTVSNYTFPKTPHGGGYEGISFINGMAFISASNPALNNSGVNVFPAVDKISLNSGQVMLTTVLLGNAQATDITSGDNNSLGSLNETDPEALSTDTKGDLVLLNQARAEAVFIAKPATAGQKVSRLSVGSELDQLVWATSTHGRFLVVDSARNASYWVQAAFTSGTAYTETASNSGVAAVLGTLNLSTGVVSPVAIGFSNPSALLFVPG